jgi:glycosyltransferase involved in cell wall biosynthesis
VGEVADILDMDIGIMPMPDDSWSRGKCGLKAIQYMAAGIPVVCAAIGANVDIVRDGVDGYCAVKASDWEASLGELCGSAELRQSMGTAARQRVASAYSLDAAVPVMLDCISSLLQSESLQQHRRQRKISGQIR